MKKSEMTKKRIIDATRTIYYEEGYQSLSIRRISEVSNVAIGNIYYYYDHKEVLVEELMAAEWQETFVKVEKRLSEVESIDEKFLEFMRVLNSDIVNRKGLAIHVMKEYTGDFEFSTIMNNPLNENIISAIHKLLCGMELTYDKKFENIRYMCEFVLLKLMNSAMQPKRSEEIITYTLKMLKMVLNNV